MELSRHQKISILLSCVTIGFASSVVFYYWRGMFLGYQFPDNTFLNAPLARFGDFFTTVTEWRNLHFTGIGYGLAYFPATYLSVQIFDLIARVMPGNVTEALNGSLFIFQILFLGFLFFLAYRALRSEFMPESIMRAFVCIAMTYPSLFTVATANFEAVLFASLAAFVCLYQSGKTLTSLPFLAFAIAMKLVPVIFVILLLADRKYKEICYVVLWVALLTVTPLVMFPGGFDNGILLYFDRLAESQKMYFDLMVVNRSGNHFGHSLLNSMRIVFGDASPLDKQVLRVYFGLALAIFLGLSYYVVYIERVFWKKVTILVCAFDLLPYTSTDYKLLHLFIPLFLFINCARSDRFDIVYAILFALILIPKSYLTLYNLDFYTTNGPINTLAMVGMTGLIVWTGVRWDLSLTQHLTLRSIFARRRTSE